MSYWFKKNGHVYCVSYEGVWFAIVVAFGLVAVVVLGALEMFGLH